MNAISNDLSCSDTHLSSEDLCNLLRISGTIQLTKIKWVKRVTNVTIICWSLKLYLIRNIFVNLMIKAYNSYLLVSVTSYTIHFKPRKHNAFSWLGSIQILPCWLYDCWVKNHSDVRNIARYIPVKL